MNTILRRVSWPVVLVGLFAPLTIHCGAINKATSAAGLPGVPQCPDMSKIDEVDKFDWVGSYKLQPKAAAQVKAGVGAAIELKALADKVDADLKASCSAIAHDLGDTADYADGQKACEAAVKAIGATKAKMGASAKVAFDFTDPHCGLDINAYAGCAGGCDATVKPGAADFQCDGGKLEGTCSGQCTGDCEASGGAACSGECDGSCDADVSGACDGNCAGKCDGKSSSGACAGKCDGKCSGNVKGTCKGKCGGGCKLSGAASCQGTCTGSCSVTMEAPKCTGTVKPPSVSAECKAKCDAQVQANVTCTPPHITLRITGAADAKAAAAFQATLEKNLPAVLDTAVGLGKNAQGLVASVKSVVGGVQTVVQSATSDKMRGAALVACVGKPFADVAGAAAAVTGSVTVSVNVQASVKAGS